MYQISDEQVDYIIDDLRKNGIETDDLLNNLLDHICIIIEQDLADGKDFQQYYHTVVTRFYTRDIKELEEETTNLLTFKNYYAMKKTMIVAGAISVITLAFGSLFKVMHWPGANVLLLSGIVFFSLLFLPILFLLKVKEVKTTRDKAVIALSSVVGILFCIATLFTFMHWPGANVMRLLSIGISALILLPLYFFTGIRNPETRLNTIMTSVILAGVTSLLFAMVNLRPSTVYEDIRVNSYQLNETVLSEMKQQMLTSELPAETKAQIEKINTLCEKIKSIEKDDYPKDYVLREGSPSKAFFGDGAGIKLIAELRAAATAYNQTHAKAPLPIANSILDAPAHKLGHMYSNVALLNNITQIQLYLASTCCKTGMVYK